MTKFFSNPGKLCLHKVPAFHGPQLFALHVGEAASDSAEEEPAEERGDDDEGIESIR